MAQTPEGRVKAAVKKYLQEIGAWYFMPVQNGMGVTGVPDFIACIDGQFVGIECKAPGKINNTSTNQKIQLDGIHAAGGLALVVDDAQVLPVMFKTLLRRSAA